LFLKLAEAAESELFGPSRRVWLERLQAEHDNLRAALGWAWEHGAAETGLRLAAALLEFWLERGYRAEGREHLTRLLSLPEASRYPDARVKALNAAGRLNRVLGDYQAAYAVYEECLSIQEQLGHTSGISECYFHLGQVARDHGEYERARTYYDRMLAIDQELGQTEIDAHKLHQLARLALEQGDFPTAERLLVQGLERLRVPKDHLDQRITSFLLVHLAEIKTALGDYPTAHALLDESLTFCRKLVMKWALAYALHRHGRLAQQQGDCHTARSRFAESLKIWQHLGGKRGIAECLEGFAGVAAAEGQREHAARLYGAAQAIRDGGHWPHLPVDQPNHEHQVDTLRAALGEEGFAAAWAQGGAFRLEQAIECALGMGD
jgi:tetratricopeptide (TPR) repeat protein